MSLHIVIKALRLALMILCVSLLVLFGPLSVWLLWRTQTSVGFSIGLAGLVLAALSAIGFLLIRKRLSRRPWLWVNLYLVLILIVCIGFILHQTPSGVPPPGSPVQHRFTQATAFPSYSLANIVPEIEQVGWGFRAMPYLDPRLTREQASRVSSFTLAVYREMDQDRNFQQLGSVLGWSYAELLGRPFDVGHYFLYVPKARAAGPLPAILFLHGSAGNFKAYLWVWSRLAEQQGMVIIAPSFGFGNWRHPEGTKAALSALDDAATLVSLDSGRIYLAGLSNGGLGVSHLAATAPERFAGLIFISAVMDTHPVDGLTFQEQWRGRPVLILAGEADDRVRLSDTQLQLSRLQASAVGVRSIIYPGEDHFLFFSQRERVLNDIAQWLSTVGRM
jgi:pimeloyl-ACP methyl ester carboxylesterase